MAMSIQKHLVRPKEPRFYTDGFRQTFEDHLHDIADNGIDRLVEVVNNDMVVYKGDFYGLLIKHNVPVDLHWFTLRLNGLHSPLDYPGTPITVKIPSKSYLEKLLKRYTNRTSQI